MPGSIDEMELSRRRMHGCEEEDAMALFRNGRSYIDDDDEVEIIGTTSNKCLRCGERFKDEDILNLYGMTTEHLCDDCNHQQARSSHVAVVAIDGEKAVATRRVTEAAMDAAIVRENQDLARQNQDIARENQDIARKNQEEARENTQAAREYADSARKYADSAQRNAEIARQNAEIAQRNAEIARQNAEIARQNAEGAQRNAEITRQNAEGAQRNAEITRKNETAARVMMAFAVMIPLVMGSLFYFIF